jgi:hypothetical protein
MDRESLFCRVETKAGEGKYRESRACPVEMKGEHGKNGFE